MSDTLGLRCVRHRNETVEPTFGFAARDRFRRQCSTLPKILRLARDDKRRGGIEDRYVPEGAWFSLKHVEQRLCVVLGIAAAQRFRRRPRKAGVFWSDLESPNCPTLKGRNGGRTGGGDFV